MAIFSGLKIWVSKQVPSFIRDDIRKHGGQIVILERDANVHLIDHTRSVLPSGAISWHWVRDSILQGTQLGEDNYRADAMAKKESSDAANVAYAASSQPFSLSLPLHRPTPEGSGVRPRSYKTPFTVADDRILLQWVAKHAAEGGNSPRSLSGNKLYMELAEQHPQHTYHSWRDRWLKRHVPALQRDPDGSISLPALRALVARDAEQVAAHAASQSHWPPASRSPPTRSVQPSPPPEDLPEDLPENLPSMPSPERDDPPLESLEHQDLGRVYDGPLMFLSKEDMAIVLAGWRAFKNGETHPSDAFFQRLASRQNKYTARQWRAMFMKFRTWYARGDSADGPASANDEADGGGADFDDDAVLDGAEATLSQRQTFMMGVRIHNTVLNFFIPLSFEIAGRIIKTFTLWSTVHDVCPDPEDRDWDTVVEALGLDAAAHPTAARDLSLWYQQILSSFDKNLLLFEDREESGDYDDGEPVAGPSSAQSPSSPEAALSAATKRTFSNAFPKPDDREDSTTPSGRLPRRVSHHGRERREGSDEHDGFEPPLLGIDEADEADEAREADDKEAAQAAAVARAAVAAVQAAAANEAAAHRHSSMEPDTQDFAFASLHGEGNNGVPGSPDGYSGQSANTPLRQLLAESQEAVRQTQSEQRVEKAWRGRRTLSLVEPSSPTRPSASAPQAKTRTVKRVVRQSMPA